ncbi:MAG TPA: hypothetical protein VMM79_18425 [Longimicrobiales bacterium]|nr:hypothetical protein [Longimicrobiales bacterium]
MSDAVLSGVGLAAGLVAVASGIQLGMPGDVWPFAVLVIGPAVVAAACAAALLLAPRHIRDNLALLAGVVVVMLPIAEVVLTVLPTHRIWAIRREPANGSVPEIDERSRVEVVEDLRAADPDVYPSIVGNVLRGDPVGRRLPFANGQVFILEVDGRRVVPLTNVSRKTIVYCNESGQYASFRTDEYGFNNPEGLWDAPVDVALIGDSFVQGACVPPSQTMAAFLRDQSVSALTVALDDFGPLSELALLHEYVAPVEPRHVVWVYYEGNDLRNLSEEKSVEILMRYLEPGFTQDLKAKRREIDEALSQFIDRNLEIERLKRSTGEDAAEPSRRPRIGQLVLRAMTLHSLRSMLGVANLANQRSLCCDIELFETILGHARETVEGWGGQLTFVYVPSGARYYMTIAALTHEPELRARGRILSAVRRVGLPVIDLHAILQETGDPRGHYYHNRSHFNPAGYGVAASAILDHIRRSP